MPTKHEIDTVLKADGWTPVKGSECLYEKRTAGPKRDIHKVIYVACDMEGNASMHIERAAKLY